MKQYFFNAAFIAANLFSYQLFAQFYTVQGRYYNSPAGKVETKNLYMDVHHFGPGKVSYEDVAKAHAKDLAIQKKFDVEFIKYWVDEKAGNVYCLSRSKNPQAIQKTHAAAHGLIPDQIFMVKSDMPEQLVPGKTLFLDIHFLGAKKVTVKDVKAAHEEDLKVQKKFGVNFINYWVNEERGIVLCLSQAPDSTAIINTHKQAHGLIPNLVAEVKQGD
jgi:hypothetical protein